MNEEEIIKLFNYVNYVEDMVVECEENGLYHYVMNCIMSMEHCNMDDYKKYLGRFNK